MVSGTTMRWHLNAIWVTIANAGQNKSGTDRDFDNEGGWGQDCRDADCYEDKDG